jgi:hypothetical protein
MKNWSSEIDDITSEFEKHFRILDAQKLNWKPNPTTWSIAQNMEHLIIINETYFPLLSQLRDGKYKKPFMGRFGLMVNFLGSTILKSVNPDRIKKMKTFPIWEPTSSPLSSDIMQRFISHQSKLKAEIAASKDLVHSDAIISSPANSKIVYKLETAFDIIVTHERRHLAQAKEIVFRAKKDS